VMEERSDFILISEVSCTLPAGELRCSPRHAMRIQHSTVCSRQYRQKCCKYTCALFASSSVRKAVISSR
jgi:hypothetical protein